MAQLFRMQALAAALTAVLCGHAQAQVPDPVSRQLADLHALLLDPSRMFSISRSLAELEAIQPQTAPDSRERGEVFFLRGLVEQKAERPGPSVKSSIEALRIDDATPFLSPHERLMTHYRVASQAKDEGNCRTAIPYYQRGAAARRRRAGVERRPAPGTARGPRLLPARGQALRPRREQSTRRCWTMRCGRSGLTTSGCFGHW